MRLMAQSERERELLTASPTVAPCGSLDQHHEGHAKWEAETVHEGVLIAIRLLGRDARTSGTPLLHGAGVRA